ncbi:FAD:protein FMN transferase [Pseudoxanthomonas sacheonensis]|uniref:FAD:protein FMN transferase n=1 Tax=Pseudoxanthomonas sacheonensis TaxID=443615 RepID=A0ABU1RMH6_9GAMM|nr:FAD:protein FMN transferase [Pseudoxanthomonas sacheonensis]MDR6839976.1 thiamine biosynthesis lipoprotein [Pseudoxanthomonas sacheonensis]
MTIAAANHIPTSACLHTLHGETMGTSWCVKLVASPRADLHAVHAGIQARLDCVVAQMSTWEADSDISRFNRSVADTWQRLPPEFFAVLSCAMETARESDGAYDPTIGALVETWGFGPAQSGYRIPGEDELAAAQGRLGWRRVSLCSQDMSALQPGGVRLDLSAIAKGYSVDLVARHLRDRGTAAALIEVGGELYGYGRKPDGSAWQVLVEATPDAEPDEEAACVIALDGIAIATSGDRWHAFEQDGTRYSHTLDPRTGKPVETAAAAVTVIADDAMHADAWATALTVMGAEAGHRFAQQRNIAARFVVRGDRGPIESMTDDFRARLPA